MASRFSHRVSDALRKGPFALPVLAFLAAYTAVLYWRGLAVGVLSDGWVLLEIGSRGLLEAPSVLLTYHTIPVTNFFMAVLWNLFGLVEWKYQVLNLAELAMIGWLVYLLGCRLFGQVRAGLLASLLFLANSSFYEVPFWPTVGNFQSLAALFYLLGIFAVLRAFRSPRPWPWLLLFSLAVLAAFFTYEPAASLLGAGVLAAFFVPAREGEAFSWRERWRRGFTTLVFSLPAIAAILGSKLYTASLGYHAVFLPASWAEARLRAFLLLRGCVSVFTLIGADHKIGKILTFGLFPAAGTPLRAAMLSFWALVVLAGAVLLLWKGSGTVRFLTLWFSAHMASVAVSTQIVSRHYYLGAVPGMLLLAWLLGRGADAVAARIARRDAPGEGRLPEAQLSAMLAFLALLLLAVNAKTDLDTAGTLFKEATEASRKVAFLVQKRLSEIPTVTPRVVLVNMPAALGKDGLGAFTFVNGLHELLRLSTQGRVVAPELVYTYAAPGDGRYANASNPASLGELARRVDDPESLVLRFDDATREVAEAKRATWSPEEYDADSAPFLDWQPGAWPWFRVYAGRPFEMPVRAPEGAWMAIRYLRGPAGVAFSVHGSARPPLAVRTPQGVAPSWPLVTLPIGVPSGSGGEPVTLDPESEVWLAGAWPFSPPEEYTPETVPFLPWLGGLQPSFLVEGPILLPLSAAGCAPRCAIEVEYLAERGRDLLVAPEGAPGRPLSFAGLAAPEWRSERLLVAASGRVAVVRIEPRGDRPLFLRRLAVERPAGDVQSSPQMPPH